MDRTIDLPALPAPGGANRFEVASKTTDTAHYTMTVAVSVDGYVRCECSCPAGERRRTCWHVKAAYALYGTRVDVPADEDDSDPFAGLD